MSNKNAFKAGLYFGISMFIFGIFWNLIVDKNANFLITLISALIGGIVGGFIFGWLMKKFGNSGFIERTTKIETETGELIFFQTAANHFKGWEATGGKLYLTNKRLVFKSHKLNFQNHEYSLNLHDIQNVERYKTLGLVNNGLLVNTNQNGKEKFVVEQVEEWMSKLTGINEEQANSIKFNV